MIEQLKKEYVDKGFELTYEIPNYIELCKRTDYSMDIADCKSRKVGEQVSLRITDNSKVTVEISDYLLNGKGLSSNHSNNNFYSLSKARTIKTVLLENTKTIKK